MMPWVADDDRRMAVNGYGGRQSVRKVEAGDERIVIAGLPGEFGIEVDRLDLGVAE
jgi:hypothetical protein